MSLIYSNWCRLCASSSENSIPIFEKDGLSNFAEKIKYYLHIEIENDANDVPRMCTSCSEKIINWDQYVEQVQKAQGMFMSLGNIDDSDEVLKKLNKEINSLNKEESVPVSNYVEEVNMVKEQSYGVNEINSQKQLVNKERKREKKQKKNRRAKKIVKLQSNDSDFSEEDEIPLAAQLECSTESLKNRLSNTEEEGEEESEKIKPKIKLKIKPIKDDRPKPVESAGEEADNGEINEYVKDDDVEMGEEEEEDEEDEDDNPFNESNINDDDGEKEDEKNETGDSRDQSKKMANLQSLFTWECLECQAPVKNWNALVKHCRDIHECNASVQCICGKHLQSRASIMKHRMKHTVGYGYKCEFANCNKTFHRQQLLDVHMLSHMPKELQPWMCCKCSRRFHTESLLKQHEKVHLPKEEKLIHPCEVCQKKFCSKSAVSAHIRAVHFGERPFVCDQCGHSFTSKGILHEHLTIHSDVYNFHCKDCNKSFKTKYRLKIHMDTHVETRYECPICSLTLNTRRTLRMHLLVHRDDKAFQCTTCGKAFKRSKDLKNHYNLHTGRRPYTCPFCLRTFANGSNCRSHKRRMHPEELKLYEAAIAAGQQPIVFRAGEEQATEKTIEPQPQNTVEFLEDSNETHSDISDSKYEANNLNNKYSDEDDKPVALVPNNNVRYVEAPNGMQQNVKIISPGPVPLNLQRNCSNNKKIKQEDEEELVQTIAFTGGENIAANLAQIAFGTQPQPIQYPIHNLYTFQSSGIPAFPGNPFFRQ